MRLGHFAALILIGFTSAGRQQQKKMPAWLAGCWELSGRGRVTIEMWMPPAGGMMLGGSRTVSGDSVREYEQVTLRLHEGRLVYTARPSGQSEATFTSTEWTDSSFTVANPEHDFPQRILYRRHRSDSLIAQIEGTTPAGQRRVNYPMRRVSCTP
jgi:hypothetical protein